MYSTTAYLYQQKQTVLLIDTSGAYFDRRWQPVYSKNLKINRGVDNVILFEFINQDQKPVNITGATFTFRLISQDGTTLLLSKDLVTLNATFGRAKVTILSTELDTVDAQPASWSLERTSGVLNEAVFTDAYAGGRGAVDINDSVYPEFMPSDEMTIPSHGTPGYWNPNRVHSSIVYVEGRPLTTFQLDFDKFTGNVKAQGSESQLGPWYDIGDIVEYNNQDTRSYINVSGFHNYLRFEINQYGAQAVANAQVANGTVSSLTLSSGGSQWFGTSDPRVKIEGQGSGAEATAVANGSNVTGITLVDGGVGYNDVPKVYIDNGAITQITYR